jgi:hypothetical protein
MQDDNILKVTEAVEEVVQDHLDKEDFSPQLMNLLRAGFAAHEVAFHFPGVTKEDFLAFVGNCWESGLNQKKVQACEVEGMVYGDAGLALNLSSHIALFGEREGILLSKKAGGEQ